jgi:hypothetical protein
MTDYRLYCVDGAGKITSAEWIDAKNDDEALAIARAQKRSVACELWERDRLVGEVDGDDPEAGAPRAA